jgi:hypothetical protein
MLEAGTPLILAIPIKRDAVPSKPTVRATTEKEFETINLLSKMQNTRRKVYTNELREPRK